MTISKTAAIRQARRVVSMPVRRSSTDYVVYAPYYDAQPDGPGTELQAASYPMILAMRTRKCACVALSIMGRMDEEAASAIYHMEGESLGVEALVAAGLAAYGTGMSSQEQSDAEQAYWADQ